jgi:hypothetical protein
MKAPRIRLRSIMLAVVFCAMAAAIASQNLENARLRRALAAERLNVKALQWARLSPLKRAIPWVPPPRAPSVLRRLPWPDDDNASAASGPTFRQLGTWPE